METRQEGKRHDLYGHIQEDDYAKLQRICDSLNIKTDGWTTDQERVNCFFAALIAWVRQKNNDG
jgi:hypothetical protein